MKYLQKKQQKSKSNQNKPKSAQKGPPAPSYAQAPKQIQLSATTSGFMPEPMKKGLAVSRPSQKGSKYEKGQRKNDSENDQGVTTERLSHKPSAQYAQQPPP